MNLNKIVEDVVRDVVREYVVSELRGVLASAKVGVIAKDFNSHSFTGKLSNLGVGESVTFEKRFAENSDRFHRRVYAIVSYARSVNGFSYRYSKTPDTISAIRVA